MLDLKKIINKILNKINNLENIFVKKNGDTLTGQLILSNDGLKTSNVAGYSIDQYGNLHHLQSGASDYLNINSYDGNKRINIYWETGNITTPGEITASQYNGTITNAKYITHKDQWVDLSSLNENTYYPVTGTGLPGNGYHMIKISVTLNSGTKPSWSTHASGFTVNLLLYTTASGWGTTGSETIVLDDYYSFANAKPVSYTQNGYNSTPVLWMRGGGKYHVFTDYDCTWTVRTSTYYTYGQSGDTYSQTVAPQSSLPNIAISSSTIRATNFYGTFNSASDIYLKENIQDISENLDLFLLNLSPKSFIYKNDNNKNINFGFIAQEVESLILNYEIEQNNKIINQPDGEEGMKYLDYIQFIPLLTHLCQSQQKQIDSLQQRVEVLENGGGGIALK